MAARVTQRQRDKPARPENMRASHLEQGTTSTWGFRVYFCITEQSDSTRTCHLEKKRLCTGLQLMGPHPSVHQHSPRKRGGKSWSMRCWYGSTGSILSSARAGESGSVPSIDTTGPLL